MAPKKSDETSEKQLLDLARKRFDLVVEAETAQRKAELSDFNFLNDQQWDEKIKADRGLDGRPCLTIDKISPSVHQVTNDQRQNKPAIKVNPVDDAATVETAEIFQGLIRHIENYSHADTAYDRAFAPAVKAGRGYMYVTTDYCDPMSFDQEIFIKSVRNPHKIYLDPHYQEPDGSDSNFGFIGDDISKDEFNERYPNSKLSKMEDWEALGNQMPGWMTKDSVRVLAYIYKTFKKVTIHQLSDGSVVEDKDLEMALAQPQQPQQTDPSQPPTQAPPLAVVNSRETTLPAIKWDTINGVEVLDSTDWLGNFIPIIPVHGDESDIDGKVTYEGLVRKAKDPQRMYNYFASSEAEAIALTPKAPFVGAAGQFKGFEAQWQAANKKPQAFLQYNPVTLNGQPMPPPQRMQAEANVMAITQARGLASEDIKAVTGIFDATLGNKSNEKSGLAIQRRNSQAQTSNYHFIDNLSKSMRHLGRILIDLIPKIYDTARIGRILHEDGEVEMVPLNQPFQKGGKDVIHDLSKGKYDIVISTGPNFETKRQEAQSGMIEFSKALPNSAPLIADLVARNSDWPGAQEIADRLKKTLPPGVADDPKDDQTPIPPQVKQMLDQQAQTIQGLSQHLHAAQDELEQKTQSQIRELASKERIALAQVQADLEMKLADINSKAGALVLSHEIGAIHKRMDVIGEQQSLEATQANQQAERDHQAQLAAQQTQNQNPTGGQPGQSME